MINFSCPSNSKKINLGSLSVWKQNNKKKTLYEMRQENKIATEKTKMNLGRFLFDQNSKSFASGANNVSKKFENC